MTKSKYDNQYRTMGHSTSADAALFFVLSRYSYNGKSGSYVHLKHTPSADTLLQVIPRNISISRGDVFSILCRPDTHSTLYYLDPPYALQQSYYSNVSNMSFDHARFLQLLAGLKSPWMLSYYDTPLLRQLRAQVKTKRRNFPHEVSYLRKGEYTRTVKLELLLIKLHS